MAAHAVVDDVCPMPENVTPTLTPPSTLDVTWEWPSGLPVMIHSVTINEAPYDVGSDNPDYNGATTGTSWSFPIDWEPGKTYEVSVTTSCAGIAIPAEPTFTTITIPTVPGAPEVPGEPEVPSQPEVPGQPQAPAEPIAAPVISEDESGATLAATGVNPWPGIVVGSLLVASGAGALVLRRRRAVAAE